MTGMDFLSIINDFSCEHYVRVHIFFDGGGFKWVNIRMYKNESTVSLMLPPDELKTASENFISVLEQMYEALMKQEEENGRAE